jgi:hypothetical protein
LQNKEKGKKTKNGNKTWQKKLNDDETWKKNKTDTKQNRLQLNELEPNFKD